MNGFDISAFVTNGGGAFDSVTGEFPVIPEPLHKKIEFIRVSDELSIPLEVFNTLTPHTFERRPYANEQSYSDLPVVAAAKILLFDPFQMFPDHTHAAPRDKPFTAYIVGTNSTGQYLLFDAVVFGNRVLAPIPVAVNRFKILGEKVTGSKLDALLAAAPKRREEVFSGVSESLYAPRERREQRPENIQERVA